MRPFHYLGLFGCSFQLPSVLVSFNGGRASLSRLPLKKARDSKQPLRPSVRVRTGEVEATADRNQTEPAKQVPRSGEHTPDMHGKSRALRRIIDTVFFSALPTFLTTPEAE